MVESQYFVGAFSSLGHSMRTVGASVRLGGDRAFYSPATDSISLPRPEQFESASAFYATSCHEHAHNADRRIMPRRRSSHRASLVRQALSFGIMNALSLASSF
jgi:antirestriction protein ArdC